MKKIIKTIVFFCIALSVSAQEDKKYNYFHPEYEDPSRKKVQGTGYAALPLLHLAPLYLVPFLLYLLPLALNLL
ncbi:MAG: hypothetical protein LBP72_02810 [Dysgonamonadaceae bacterium]|nr:hypothetical protein [Dysgonamonadaceae bacterium]